MTDPHSQIDAKGVEAAHVAVQKWMDWCIDHDQEPSARSGASEAIRAYLGALIPAAKPVGVEGLTERIQQRISVFREMTPEDDEPWHSWYLAAFDMLSAEVAALSAGTATPGGETARYQVTAIMKGSRTRLVVSDGDNAYSTEDRAAAERVLAEVQRFPAAYRDARIEPATPGGEK
jgi:hypothetical protein